MHLSKVKLKIPAANSDYFSLPAQAAAAQALSV